MMKRFLSYSVFSKTLGFILRPRPANALFSSSSYSTASATAPLKPRSMTEYLVTTCGFSREMAVKTSAKLRSITTLHQLDSVVRFFRSFGLDDAHMRKLLSWDPGWLFLDMEKCLVPKLQALQDLGFSPSDVVQLLGSSPIILSRTVETVVAKIQFWQGILGSRGFMSNIHRNGQWLLGYSITNRIQLNIDILRECGVTDRKLTLILKSHPRIIGQRTEDLKALICRLESLGVPRFSGMFHWNLWVLCIVSEKKFNAHLELFKGLGWSEDEFFAAFRKAPSFLTSSSKCLQKKMEFLVKEVGFDPSFIAAHPVFLTLSLEKRLIPRCRIFTILKSRGSWGADAYKLTSFLLYGKETFFNKFIFGQREKFPEIYRLYEASQK